MRKLMLESLQVESFETTVEAARCRGTVDGHAAAYPDSRTCPPSAVSVCAPCESQEPIRCGTSCDYGCTTPCTFWCSNGCSNGTGCEASCWLPADSLVCQPD
ncbi:MAG TPA: hypothetical protein VFT45_13760 [Longimicrobium sp.]|nr:hypothetical protein [Longimicrobium sp.]